MDPFLGQIILFAGNFAPRGWSLCEGQLLSINANQALFSILGTTYGGDGRTTFALPDLRGRVPVSQGNGAGLSDYRLGEKGGSEQNTITINEMPAHTHNVSIPGSTAPADESQGFLAAANIYAEDKNATYPNVTLLNNGGQQPINNMQPWLALNYIIAMQGVFPSRN